MLAIRTRLGRFCLHLLLCLLSVSFPGCDRQSYRDVVQDFSDRPVGEIVAGVTVGQTFVANHNSLNGVSILMATYARKNDCNLVFHVRREGEYGEIVTRGLKCADIQDNNWVRFDFPAVKDSLGRKFLFFLESPDGSRENSVTIWMASLPNIYPEGRTLINGEPIPGALRFITYHEG